MADKKDDLPVGSGQVAPHTVSDGWDGDPKVYGNHGPNSAKRARELAAAREALSSNVALDILLARARMMRRWSDLTDDVALEDWAIEVRRG